MLENKKNQGSILIYVLIITTVVVMMFSFIAVQALNNLGTLHLIKKSIALYTKSIWLQEELTVNYYDDPVYNSNLSNQSKNAYVSRYKSIIEGFVSNGSSYALSLTDLDNEYGSAIKSLKYVDVLWNDTDKNALNRCDLNTSFLRWNKGNIESLSNKKTVLLASMNASLVSVSYRDNQTIDIYFSTGITNMSGGVLTAANFLFSWSGTLQSVTKITDAYYTGSLSGGVPANVMECTDVCYLLGVKENSVKSTIGNLDGDLLSIRKNRIEYLNRTRIKDSVDFLNTSTNNFSLFLSSPNLCFFAMEGFNGNNIRVPLPDRNMLGNVELYDPQNNKINRKNQFLRDVLIGAAVSLSNYLYKIY